MSPLKGARVLDFGHYIAGPLSAMLLAEQGADVVHVTPPGGERWSDASNAYLQRMKTVIAIDLRSEDGRRTARQLARDVDVVIDNFRPGVLERLGVVRERELAQRIWLSLPGFAPADVRASTKAWEGIVGAATGLFTDVHVAREFLGLPPVFTALPLASVYGAVNGATAVAAALLRRTKTGRGTRIHVPLADALFHAMGSIIMDVPGQPSRYDIPPVSRVVRRVVMPVVRSLVRNSSAARLQASTLAAGLLPPLMDSYRCADDRLLYVFAMDHDAIPRRLMETIGVVAELEGRGFVFAPASDDDATGRNLADAARLSRGRRRALRDVLARVFASRSAASWEHALNDAGVPSAIQRTADEWMDWQPVRSSELIVRLDDPEFGPIDMPGVSVNVGTADTGPALASRTLSDAPAVSARLRHRARFWSLGDDASAEELPLAGMTAVDLSSMVAGPIAARTLAEYGARVWKVEPPSPRHGPRMTRWYGIDVNQGKDSVVLDVASAEGQSALHELLSRTDVLVHNLRPAAARACGVTPESLRRFDALVVASVGAYGGRCSAFFDGWPGYDPVLQASSGITMRYGGPARPELHAIASSVDYLTGDLLAFGVLAALLARSTRANDRAMHVRASLAQGAQLAQATLLTRPRARLPDSAHGQEATGLSPTNRIFQTRDGYVFAVIPPDALTRLGIEVGAIEQMLRAKATASAMKLLEAAGAAWHEVRSVRQTKRESLSTAKADIVSLGSLVTITASHPAGSMVTTVYPGHVRAEPALVRGLRAATKRGEAQQQLEHILDRPLPPVADEPYLPS